MSAPQMHTVDRSHSPSVRLGGSEHPPAPQPPAPCGHKWVRRAGWAAGWALVLFVLAQFVPYGHWTHTNPPVTAEPKWDSPQTRALAVRACFDCHSNLTRWPWYSHLAPVSWLVQHDVNAGRSKLDFTEWNRPQEGPSEATGEIASGSMPPWLYPLMHPKAELSKPSSGG